MKPKALLALIILLIFPLLGACSTRELNGFGLVIALGIDKDADGYLVTYQVLNPKAVASRKSNNESTFVLYSEKGSDLAEIERRVSTQAARRMYFAHVRSIVIAEEVARDGLKEILDYLYRSSSFRSDFYFIIAKGATANQILSTVTTIESVSGMKLFESIESSKDWWAAVSSLKLVELVNDINSVGKEAVLAGVEFYQKTEDMDTITELEKSNPGKLKLADLGVFQDDKLIGWLNEEEGLAFNNIVGKTKNTVTSVDYDNYTHVSLDIIMNKTKIKVSLSDGKPIINVKFSAEMGISTITGNVDFTDKKNLDKLNLLVNDKFADICTKTVDKAQHELRADIFGFGECIHRAYPKVWNELKDNWESEFAELQVTFKIDTKIRDLGSVYTSIISEDR